MGYVSPEGNGTLGVMMVGEAGGRHERATGLPFRPNAPAGSVLERAIKRAGYSRSQFRIINAVNCLVGESQISAQGIELAYRRPYVGDTILVGTRSGKGLAGTPNHPVLTQRGMVALGQLQLSDHMVSGSWQEHVGLGYPNIQHRPSSFVELYDALSVSGVSKRTVGSNMDFHGDGMNAKIDIVATDWLLRNGIEPSLLKHLTKRILKPSDLRSSFLAYLRSTNSSTLDRGRRALLAFDGFMRRLGDLLAVVGSHYAEAQTCGFGPIAHANIMRGEQPSDSALPSTQLSSQGLKSSPAQVGFDEIVSIKRNWFSGHVYNLQTECGQYIANGFIVSNCTPPRDWIDGAPWEFGAIAHCEQHRRREINRMRPKVILALGSIAFRTLTGFDGKNQGIAIMRGYPIETEWGTVIGTYHPSFLVRGNMRLLGVLIHDIQKAVQIARQGWQRREVQYTVRPSLDDAERFYADAVAHPELPLAFDIETDRTQTITEEEYGDEEDHTPIVSIQFSLRAGEGIFFPWQGEMAEIAKRVLKTQSPKVGHNCFARDTSVWMADGSWRPIWGVKVGERVMSSVKGVLMGQKVVDTPRSHDPRAWMEVVVDGAYNAGVGRWGNPGVVCTEDHEWQKANGDWTEAGALNIGDELILPRMGSDHLILGTLLGDGHASRDKELKITHSNEAWAAAKARNLGVSPIPRCAKTAYLDNSNFWEMRTPIPGYWRDLCYNGKSRLWPDVAIPPAALAVFYGDDGCLAKPTRGGNATLALHKYGPHIPKIKAWFETLYGRCSIHNDAVLYMWQDASQRFFEAIARWLHPSMAYKLPPNYRGQYGGWMEIPTSQIGKVTALKPRVLRPKLQSGKYCLSVALTHSFFTRSGLVSNCWRFDNPKLEAAGAHVRGQSFDTMEAFRHLQRDLVGHYNLQSVASFYGMDSPWKHLSGSEPEWYGVADVDAVQRIWAKLPGDLRARGLW